MPHHKSCKKRLKTSKKARLYNKAYKSNMRHSLKAFRAVSSAEEATGMLPALSSQLDKLAKKGIIKRGTANRMKSRLAIRAGSLAQQSQP